MAVILIDGFEKYGPPVVSAIPLNSPNANLLGQTATLTTLNYQGILGEWFGYSLAGNTSASLVTGRQGAPTVALSMLVNNSNAGPTVIYRNLATTYTHVIVGFAFLTAGLGSVGCVLANQSAGAQSSVWLDSTGHVNVSRSTVGGANILFTSSQTVTANSWHYIELDITINASTGQFSVYLDGVLLTTTAANQNTGASTVNQIQFGITNVTNASFLLDDLYLFDNTGSFNNAVRGDSTVETLFPTSDSAVVFGATQYAIGFYVIQTTATVAPGANIIALLPVTPSVNATITAVALIPQATSAGAKFKGVVYSDNAGSPGSLLSSGTEVIGCTATTVQTLPITTPQSLTGGTQYWIGYITDTSVVIQRSDNTTTSGQSKANTYSGGAPAGPLAGMSTAQPTWAIWGICSGTTTNVSLIKNKPAAIPFVASIALQDYVSSSSVNDQDLYNCAPLSVNPTSIGCLKVSVFAQKSISGARTFDVRVKSGLLTSSGNTSGFVPIANGSYYSSYFETDPSTGLAWGATGVNTMKAGFKVVT